MTQPLTRLRPDGTREYLCCTTGRYYVPTVTQADITGALWCWCTECDTSGRFLVAGAQPQPHLYPMEFDDAPVYR